MSEWTMDREAERTDVLSGRSISSHMTSRGQQLASEAMTVCPVAICVIDRLRTIQFANPEFRQLTRLCPVLGNGSHIAVQSGSLAKEIRDRIASVIERGEGATVHLPLADHAHDLSVLISPMRQDGLILLTIVPPRALMIDHAQLQRALRLKWSLSQREAECAILLGQGLSATRMAEAQNVSLPTIRTHLQSIREKLGVGSSLEAAIKVAALCRPCGGAVS